MAKNAIFFDEYFESGFEESISPILEKKSKKISKNFLLKVSIFSAILLAICYLNSFFEFFNVNISYILLSFIYLFLAIPSLLNAIEDIKNFQINISVLMTLAGFLSILLKSPLEGALLFILYNISHSLEHLISFKTKSAIYDLNKISPTKASVINEDKSLSEKFIQDIKINDKIFIKTGEVIPLDGKVIQGSSNVNQLHLTGESLPVFKKAHDLVYAGSICIDGHLTVLVTKEQKSSTIAKIINLINQAKENKPKIERFIDKFSKAYSSSIIALTFIFALILPIFNIPFLGKEGSIYRSITFLIATSPCALIIGAPLAYLTSISGLAKKGIILKGGFILDALQKCDTIAFDKTGTLTTADMQINLFQEIPLDNKPLFDLKKAIFIAKALEKGSSHPIAKAIERLKNNFKAKIKIEDFKSIPSLGLQATILLDDKKHLAKIGKKEFIEKFLHIDTNKIPTNQNNAKVYSYLVIDGHLFEITLSDEIRTNAFDLITKLKPHKKIIMLTGDNHQNASFVSDKLNIDTFFSNLQVEDKLRYVSKFSKQGLIMVGDGINDAPSLSRATVGISLGKIGSATAIDASDVILLNDDILSIDALLKKSILTTAIARQNLIFSVLIVLLASIPSLLGLLPLWLAILLHEGSTVLVGLNALRLLTHVTQSC
jgi:Zn2+/Cd2+-exporting ATPase